MSKVAFVITLLFSCELWADSTTVYIYEGKYSNNVALRIESDCVYSGRFDYPVKYKINFNYIIDATTNAILYRIENNFIYKGRYDGEVVARVEGDYILKGRYDPTVLYRIEKK